MTIYSSIIATLVIFQFLSINADRPKCTIIIFRHGYENSYATLKEKRYQGQEDWEGFKDLITARGMKQLYDLGKSKRERYGHLLGPVYDPFQITVTSTNTKTAIMSAQAFLAGLYPVNNSLKFDPEIAWRPVPVHTVPIEENDLLYKLDNCPRHKYFLKSFYNTIKYDRWLLIGQVPGSLSDYQWVRWIVQNNTNIKIEPNTLTGLANVYYSLRIQELQNGTPPAWTREIYPEPLRTIYGIAFEMNFAIDEMARMAVGTTILKIFNDLYAMHKNKQSQKVIIYSTHDVIIPYLLHILDLKRKELPLLGAYLQFELIDAAKDTTGIQITYNGEPLRVPDCGHFCPFFEFRKRHEHLYVQDFKNACRHDDNLRPAGRQLGIDD